MKTGPDRYIPTLASGARRRSPVWLRVIVGAALFAVLGPPFTLIDAARVSALAQTAPSATQSTARPATTRPATAKPTASKPKRPKTDPAGQAKARDQQKRESKGFIDTIMQGPRLSTTPPEAADWVRASRPAPGAQRAAAPPQPGRAVLTPDEIRAKEAQLEALRNRHDRLAGRKPPQGKFGSAAGKPPEQQAERYQPNCVMTCSPSIGVSRAQRR